MVHLRFSMHQQVLDLLDNLISLVRGKKYHFSVNASGHPFQIQTSYQNGGTAFVDGITNNGAAVGVVTFKVPFNA